MTILALTMIARDEADIICESLRFHLEHGVDFAIVTDNGSRDGTRELLAELERAFPRALTVLDEPSPTFEYRPWMEHMIGLARDRGAAWVLPTDADEFWFAADGRYRTDFQGPATLVTAHWRNMVPVEGADWRAFTHSGEMHVYDTWTPKLAVRTEGFKWIAQGAHQAYVTPYVARESTNLCLYHYPIRSYAQFERKVVNMGQATLANPDTREVLSVNHHVRAWYESYLAGRLREDYAAVIAGARNVTPDDTMRQLLAG